MTAPNRTIDGYRYCYGSSELGGCIKGLVALRLGYEPMPTSEKMQALFDRGHAHEDECVAAMRKDGWVIDGRQLEEVIDCGNDIGVVIHYDAIDPDHEKVIEIKAPSTWASFERAVRTNTFTDPYMARIAWQVSAQMVASGLEAVIACYDGTVRTFGIEVPIYSREEIVARVESIEQYAGFGDLPAACSQADWPCPFAYLHEPDDRTEITDEAVIASAAQYVQLGEQIAELEAARKMHYDALKLLGEGRYLAGPHAVTVYEQAGAVTLDRAALRHAGVDLTAYEKVGKPSVRAKITRRGEY